MLKTLSFCGALIVVAMAGPAIAQTGEVTRAAVSTLPDRHPDRALLTEIVSWLSANFDLPESENLPRVEFVPQSKMASLRYGALLTARTRKAAAAPNPTRPSEPASDVLALYDDRENTIYLLDNWTGSTPADLSILVHEMVHYLQSEAHATYECAGAREKLAFQAQNKWLDQFGRRLESEFAIDPMTLLVKTSCAFPP